MISARRRDALRLVEHDVVQVDRAADLDRVGRVGTGEMEEVVDQRSQVVDLVAEARHDRVGVEPVGAVDVEFGSHPRQRAAQLV